MRHKFYLAFVAAFAVFPLGSAIAQVGESGYSLPLALAVKAATKAIETCKSNGYPVSAVVVDPSGVIRTSRWFVKMRGVWRQLHHHGSIEEPALLAEYQRAILGTPLGPAS
jgi:hypothetical protein